MQLKTQDPSSELPGRGSKRGCDAQSFRESRQRGPCRGASAASGAKGGRVFHHGFSLSLPAQELKEVSEVLDKAAVTFGQLSLDFLTRPALARSRRERHPKPL